MNDLDLLLEEIYYKTDENMGLCLEDYSKLNDVLKSVAKDEMKQMNKDMQRSTSAKALYKKYNFNPNRRLTSKEKSNEYVKKLLDLFRIQDISKLKEKREMSIKLADSALINYDTNKDVSKLKMFLQMLAATLGVTIGLIVLTPIISGAMLIGTIGSIFSSKSSEKGAKDRFMATSLILAILNEAIYEKEKTNVSESYNSTIFNRIYNL